VVRHANSLATPSSILGGVVGGVRGEFPVTHNRIPRDDRDPVERRSRPNGSQGGHAFATSRTLRPKNAILPLWQVIQSVLRTIPQPATCPNRWSPHRNSKADKYVRPSADSWIKRANGPRDFPGKNGDDDRGMASRITSPPCVGVCLSVSEAVATSRCMPLIALRGPNDDLRLDDRYRSNDNMIRSWSRRRPFITIMTGSARASTSAVRHRFRRHPRLRAPFS